MLSFQRCLSALFLCISQVASTSVRCNIGMLRITAKAPEPVLRMDHDQTAMFLLPPSAGVCALKFSIFHCGNQSEPSEYGLTLLTIYEHERKADYTGAYISAFDENETTIAFEAYCNSSDFCNGQTLLTNIENSMSQWKEHYIKPSLRFPSAWSYFSQEIGCISNAVKMFDGSIAKNIDSFAPSTTKSPPSTPSGHDSGHAISDGSNASENFRASTRVNRRRGGDSHEFEYDLGIEREAGVQSDAQTEDPEDSASWSKQNWWVYVIGVLVIIVIILSVLLVVNYIRRGQKKLSKEKKEKKRKKKKRKQEENKTKLSIEGAGTTATSPMGATTTTTTDQTTAASTEAILAEGKMDMYDKMLR